jgi:hypothetical protein
LGKDFLSPVVAGMLFPDLLQRFIPVPIAWADRQRFLESSWEQSLPDPARTLFRGPFQAMYADLDDVRLPSLLLNATLVETGQRGLVSNLDVGQLPQVIDLLDPRYQLEAVRTSAAAGASARFTYVSPAGTVHVEGGDELRLVDGGYFENSGAASLADLVEVLHASTPGLRPIMLVINNDPTAVDLCRRDGGGASPPNGGRFNAAASEVTAPMKALLQTRDARGNLAQVNAVDLVESMGGTVIEVPLAAVLRTRLSALRGADPAARERVVQRYVEPPLGWSLSAEVRRGMDEALDGEIGGLATQFEYLEIALGIRPGEVPRCVPQ